MGWLIYVSNEYFFLSLLIMLRKMPTLLIEGMIDVKRDTKGITDTRGRDDTMAAVSKPINKVVVVDANKTKQFLNDFNKNKVSVDFMNSCKKAAKLFEGDKKD